MLSVKFAGRRAQASRDVQATFKVAVRDLKSLEAWDADLAALEKLVRAERRQRAQGRRAAQRWQETLDQIQSLARDMKKVGKIRFRKDAVKYELVSRLRTEGRSRTAIQQQGQAAQVLWREVFPEWKMLGQVAVGELGDLLARALVLQDKHLTKQTAWRSARMAMMEKARGLDLDCLDWFTVATVNFPAGTVEGDLILARVPTTTRPRPSRAKPKGAAIKMVERKAELMISFPEEPEQTAA